MHWMKFIVPRNAQPNHILLESEK